MGEAQEEKYSVDTLQGMVRTLISGQTHHPTKPGEYTFSFPGQGVWERGQGSEADGQHEICTPTAEWLGGLAFAAGVAISQTELAELAFQLGLQLGRDEGAGYPN